MWEAALSSQATSDGLLEGAAKTNHHLPGMAGGTDQPKAGFRCGEGSGVPLMGRSQGLSAGTPFTEGLHDHHLPASPSWIGRPSWSKEVAWTSQACRPTFRGTSDGDGPLPSVEGQVASYP